MNHRLKDLRILITGAQGQVGFELTKALATAGAELVVSVRKESRAEEWIDKTVVLDLNDKSAVRTAIRKIRPNILINAAAYTAVDKAETEKELAQSINCDAIGIMAEEMSLLRGGIIHFSTDYVYNPKHDLPIHEDEEQNPSGIYAKSKAAGDAALIASDLPFVILRTSWVYGINGNNFVKTMLKLGRNRDSLRIVADQFGSPTSAVTLAQLCTSILRKDPSNPLKVLDADRGVYNVSDSGYTNWFLFAQEIFEYARTLGLELCVKQVDEISSSDYQSPVARPMNSRLSLAKLEKTFDFYPPDWKKSLRCFMYEAQLGLNGF